jgi:hypothetical protein
MPLPTEFYVVNITAANIGEVIVVAGFSGGLPVLTSKPISEIHAAAEALKKRP